MFGLGRCVRGLHCFHDVCGRACPFRSAAPADDFSSCESSGCWAVVVLSFVFVHCCLFGCIYKVSVSRLLVVIVLHRSNDLCIAHCLRTRRPLGWPVSGVLVVRFYFRLVCGYGAVVAVIVLFAADSFPSPR